MEVLWAFVFRINKSEWRSNPSRRTNERLHMFNDWILRQPALTSAFSQLVHLPGCNCGMIWIAEDPDPTTATTLSLKSALWSHLAEWSSGPSKVSNPGIAGHFQLFSSPPALRRTWNLVSKCLVRSGESSTGISSAIVHSPSSSSQTALTSLWLYWMYFSSWYFFATALKYSWISTDRT